MKRLIEVSIGVLLITGVVLPLIGIPITVLLLIQPASFKYVSGSVNMITENLVVFIIFFAVLQACVYLIPYLFLSRHINNSELNAKEKLKYHWANGWLANFRLIKYWYNNIWKVKEKERTHP